MIIFMIILMIILYLLLIGFARRVFADEATRPGYLPLRIHLPLAG